MTEDLQSLLEKINRDGVEKAQAEADKILAAARSKAETIVREASESAARAKAEGERAAADYAERAKETLQQAARDTILKIENDITQLLTRLLVRNVDKALGDEKTLLALVTEAIGSLAGEKEVAINPKLAQALQAALAARGEIKIVTDETLGTGFSVRTEGGRIEHTFTGAAIAGALAQRLRPDLAALLK